MTEFPIPPRKERGANPKFVRILKWAREELWDGNDQYSPTNKSRYICHIISRSDETIQTCSMLSAEIGDCLGWALTYEGWLHRTTRGVHYRDMLVEIQAARLRWINQLIEEYGGTP